MKTGKLILQENGTKQGTIMLVIIKMLIIPVEQSRIEMKLEVWVKPLSKVQRLVFLRAVYDLKLRKLSKSKSKTSQSGMALLNLTTKCRQRSVLPIV